MGDVLRRTGVNYALLFPDDRTNITLNSSTAGDNGIATTSFEGMLFCDGEVVATNLTALEAPPYLLTIDNVSGTFGAYKVNVTLPSRATYDLFLRHTTDIVTVRQEQFDTTTRPEIMSLSQGNTRMDFTIAGANIPARNVATGVLDKITATHYADGATVGPSAVTSTQVYELTYNALGDTNPSAVIPT